MKVKKIFFGIICLLTFSAFTVYAKKNGKIQILLIGDSTTKGATPRAMKPNAPQFADMVTLLLNAESDIPKVKTYNSSHGGETASTVFSSGRYSKEIAYYKNKGIDYIFVRYGINDWFKCKNVEKEFPNNLEKLLKTLKSDFPNAKIIPATIVPFLDKKNSLLMNAMIRKVAKKMNMPLFDVYVPYKAYLDKQGPNTLNVRNIHLDSVSTKYHSMLKPYISLCKKGKGNYMQIQSDDNRLDPILGNKKEWFNNRHPNLAGYYLIANETAKYLHPLLKNNH